MGQIAAAGLAAVVGLVVLAGCAAAPIEDRRCFDMVGSGQHSHRMVAVPCPAEPAPSM